MTGETKEKLEKLKVLVVDDESDNLDLLYRTFRRDFRVWRATSGAEALEVLDREGEMAIIISDQRMPVMNGTELLRQSAEKYPETIRILLTGYTDVEDLVAAINRGQVFKYITKPWQPDHLKAVIQQAADTYIVLKQRTHELRRALRRQELLNEINQALRGSLDYDWMLQTIVDHLAMTFRCPWGRLQGVEEGKLLPTVAAVGEGLEVDVWHRLQEKMEGLITQPASGPLRLTPEDGGIAGMLIDLRRGENLLGGLFLGDPHPQGWDEENLALVQVVTEQAALAISQAQLYRQILQQADKMRSELEVACQIQHNFLPQQLPELPTARIQARCDPAREVGGDFYEVYVHPQGDIWFALGDVSGKGVPAALFMASALSILRRELAQGESPEPEQVLANLNQAMADDLFGSNCFITMVLCCYRPEQRELIYANAGHIYPMVWNHRQVQEESEVPLLYLKTRSIPIGILTQWRQKQDRLFLQPDDLVFVSSDGLTEATLKTGGMLQQEGLWHLMKKEPFPFSLDALMDRFHDVTVSTREDDQTAICLEVR